MGAHTFRNLSTKDGLTDLVINDIYKDNEGYVWFGTSSSVIRFDGISFKSFIVPAENLKDREVNVAVSSSDGDVLFGANNGLWKIHNDEVVKVAGEDIKCRVLSLHAEDSGAVFIGSENGLFILEKDSVRHILLNRDIVSEANNVTGVTLYGDKLWMATSDGLYSLGINDGNLERCKPSDVTISESFNRICRIKDTLYLSSNKNGIIKYDMNSRKFERFSNISNITALSYDGNGHMYIGTNGDGIYKISTSDGKTVDHLRHMPNNPEGLSSNSIYSLLIDNDGIIWAGLFQLGVDYTLFQRNIFTPYEPANGNELKNYAVRCLETGPHGLLVGTRDGLFFTKESRNIFKHFSDKDLRAQMIMCSYEYKDLYYIGTHGGGLYVFNPETVELSDFNTEITDPFISGDIFSITSDRWDNLWIATSNGLFSFHDGKPAIHLDSKNSKLPNENIYNIFFDSMNRGWICTDSRMLLMDATKDRNIIDKFPAGFINNRLVRTIYEDSGHTLYFLPNNGNLFKSNLELTDFGEVKGLPFDGLNLTSVIEDNDGWLWIGSSNGLYRYDKTGKTKTYTFADGVPSSLFLNCAPQKDITGRIWFGCSKGVFHTNGTHLNDSVISSYPVRITDIISDGTSYPVSDHVSIQSCKDELTIRFSDFTYTDPQYMRYEYMLEGKDNDWTSLEGKSEVSYHGLGGGSYRFRVRTPGDEDNEFDIHISIPGVPVAVWITVAFGLIICAGFIYYLFRNKSKHKTGPDIPAVTITAPRHEDNARKAVAADDAPAPDTTITSADTKDPDDDKYKSYNISREECENLRLSLERLMAEQRPYVNPKLKISDLATMMGVPAHKLSYLFNQHLDSSFYDYINDYRINEFKGLVTKGDHKLYTINTLMEKCGFASRTVFFRYFKSKVGQTPSKYIKDHM